MDFALNEEQLELQEMVREFVEKEITPYAAEMDAENHMRDGLIDKANEMGLLNVIVPEELDGPGLDSISVATIMKSWAKAAQVLQPLWLPTAWQLYLFCWQAPTNKRKCIAIS